MSLKKINTKGRIDVYTYDNFISDAHCDHLMKIIDANHERATIIAKTKDNKTKSEVANTRTNSSCHVLKYDPIAMMYDANLCELLNIDQDSCDNTQGLFYDTEQKYNCHMDAHVEESIVKSTGQRTWTAIAYLNTPEKGGATKFCKFDLQIEAVKGRLLLWNNILADGSINPQSQHAGMPVISGRKYCVVKWFKEFKQNNHSCYTGEPHLKVENYPVNLLK